ncbi:aminotransferase class I/II-fold pyridoxal phosphate-dependent enzyme [Pseudooceanicola sp. CBS1P-1]|uniref:Aminotransferase class I/II-fold pyridoxal phosphate-dependent enzyme n=1 Tax=Pseudooceanicola albus TaxID=2692189 RepID=A0A6L7GAC8_9RHOB|nr:MULTISPECIES: aminotransferase class I/II-fold pyridoxal phosphate-dependent enzyme [Pseudooceanicola]MBT9386514.1 aminotransferase class I/II-fold pyridoxal phosphate-dependent enzyme [Pseudooceanicola endophyticus]MXN20547.1 aminotransferase class I/II-fold pyridoxal phosphate-dependent enzyme [Pseudooceanicola albus]
MTLSTARRGLDPDIRRRMLSQAGAAPVRPEAGLPRSGGPAPGRLAGLDRLEAVQRGAALERALALLDLEPPYFRMHDGHAGAETRIADRACLNFATYDYLGLNADPRPARAAVQAIGRYGVSAGGSRMVSGERPVHRALEARLARHYNSEAALSFVSGHGTNMSLLAAVTGPGDLIVHDAHIHNSVRMGAALSGASVRSFAHNDLAALERILAHNRPLCRNLLIVVEGLYSMDGDLPNLPGLLALRDCYDAWLMVDEAHALGCVGARGQGVAAHYGLDPACVDIWMGTLSKTLASTGGYVAGSGALIRLLKHEAAGHVFSVALPPMLAASALCALELLEQEPERCARLRENGAYFAARAAELGLNTGTGQGFGIMPVMVGASPVAVKLSERLLEAGVNVAPVTFPGVPMNAARLRFFLSSDHTEAQIDQGLRALRQALDRLEEEGFLGLVEGLGAEG